MNIDSFANLVFFYFEREKKIEIIRQVLCEIPQFEPYSIFKLLDKKQKNYLDTKDIEEFLSENGEDFPSTVIESSLVDYFSNDDKKINYKK